MRSPRNRGEFQLFALFLLVSNVLFHDHAVNLGSSSKRRVSVCEPRARLQEPEERGVVV